MPAPVSLLTEYLRREKLKMTPQRRLILDIFWETPDHLTAEELYTKVKEADPTVGQATVYRTLKLLAESGLATEVDFGDGRMRYENRHGRDHHDHLICERCRRTIDIVDDTIERLQEKIAAKHGFRLTGHQFSLYGVCPDCRAKQADH